MSKQITEEVMVFFRNSCKEQLITSILNAALVAYDKLYKKTDNENCAINDHDLSLDFYCNDESTRNIMNSTNLLIMTDNYNFSQSMGGIKVIDIYNHSIYTYQDLSEEPLCTIDITGLVPDSIDEGYLFQLNTTTEYQPFSTEQLKTIITIANRLQDDKTRDI